jgi:hypothetical protein
MGINLKRCVVPSLKRSNAIDIDVKTYGRANTPKLYCEWQSHITKTYNCNFGAIVHDGLSSNLNGAFMDESQAIATHSRLPNSP